MLTRALERESEIHTVWGGGAYNAPPSISAPMRAAARHLPTSRGEETCYLGRFEAPNESLERFELENISWIRKEFQRERPADIAQVLNFKMTQLP